MTRALSLVRVARFFLRILFIVLLLALGRGSLALWVWGRGRICSWIAQLYDADPGMYQRLRWKEERKPVYWRNKCPVTGLFTCEASGYQSADLGEFHVDHILSRAGFPMLAYEQWNLRLIRKNINVAKSDKLSVGFFIWFFVTQWNAQSFLMGGCTIGAILSWHFGLIG